MKIAGSCHFHVSNDKIWSFFLISCGIHFIFSVVPSFRFDGACWKMEKNEVKWNVGVCMAFDCLGFFYPLFVHIVFFKKNFFFAGVMLVEYWCKWCHFKWIYFKWVFRDFYQTFLFSLVFINKKLKGTCFTKLFDCLDCIIYISKFGLRCFK